MADNSRPVRRRRLAPALLVVSAGLSAITGLLALSGTAGASTTPQAAATPNTNVGDGQFINLAMSGFAPGAYIYFRECIPTPVDLNTDCTPLITGNPTQTGQPINTAADSHGKATALVPVFSGSDQWLTNAGGTGPLTCDSSHTCSLALVLDSTSAPTLLVPITFAPAANDCPPPGANEVVGSGAAPAYQAMNQWEAYACQPPDNLSVGYAGTNSPDGATNFLAGVSQFAVTGPWAPSSAPSTTTAQTWDYAPLTMTGVVIGFRMYDLRTNAQITSLKLTPDQIAGLFSGHMALNDPSITALNPGVNFPNQIFMYGRAEHSSETWTFTSWLARAASSTAWPFGASEIWPTAASGPALLTGANAVGRFTALSCGIGTGSGQPCTYPSQGSLSYLDSSTAAFYGVPTVTIVNPDGTTTPVAGQQLKDALSKAVSDATVNADGTVTPSTSDEAAWPMLLPTYMMVPTNTITLAQGAQLASFLSFALSPDFGQSPSTLPLGYVPLTDAMRSKSTAAANAIPQGGVEAASTPGSTTSGDAGATGSSTTSGETGLGLGSALPRGSSAATSGTPSAPPRAAAAKATAYVAQPLAVSGGGQQFVLPALGGAAFAALVAGAGLEVYSRRRLGQLRWPGILRLPWRPRAR